MATEYQVNLLFSAPKTPALDQLNRQLKELDDKAKNIGGGAPFKGIEQGADKASVAVSGLMRVLGPLAAAAAAAFSFQKIVGSAAQIETQTRAIQTLTGSLGEAKQIIKELQDYGAVTPFTSSELIDTAKRLKAFGVATQDVVATTKRLGDVAGATGSNIGELATAYGQVQAKGRLQSEELMQFQERGVALGEELRKMYGDKFPKALEKGQISAKAVEVALTRLTEKGGQYAGGAINQSDTLAGKFSTLEDGIERLAGAIGTILAPALKSALDYANAALEEMLARVNELTTGSTARQDRFKQAEKQAEYETINKFGRFTLGNEAPEFMRKRREEIFRQKMKELQAAPSARKVDTTIPALTQGTAAAGESVESKLAKARADTIEKLTELEKDAAKEVRDLNLDYIKDIAEARKQAIKDAKELEKDLLKEQRDTARTLEDSQAALKLQKDIGGLGGSREERAFQKGLLEEAAAFQQRERDRKRGFEDKQRELALKLENFKVKTAETIGNINKKYLDNYGKIQEKYAENVAKIIQAGATNAGRILEAAATNAANTLAGGGGGVPTGSVANQGNPNAKLIADTLTKKLNLSPVAIAGALGNLDYESGGLRSANIIQGGRRGRMEPGLGYGFAQWTDPIRQARLRERAGGSTSPSAQVQAEFLVEELTKYFPDALRALRNSQTVEEATKAVQDLYLMPFAATQSTAERIRRAQGYLGANATGAGGVVARTGATGVGTAAHLDVRWGDGRPITKEDADKYMILNGKPPSAYGVTSGYGPRTAPTAGASTFHRGIDFGAPEGTPITLKGGATAGKSYFDPNGGGQVLEINTPQGTMKLLHLGKGSTVSGGAMAAGGAQVSPQLVPLPKPLPPQPGPDIRALTAPLEKLRADILQKEGEALKNATAEDIQKIRNDRSDALREISGQLDDQIKQGEVLATQEERRLGYLQQGISPELADQFSQLDAQTDAMREQLEMQIRIYEQMLATVDLTDQQRKLYQDLVDLARQQAGELDAKRAQRRDQLVEADQKKKSPRTKLIEEVADRQEKLNDLLNPANQLISAADSIGSAFGQAFQDTASGSKTAKEAMGDMLRSIGASFIKMAADILAQQAALSILKLFTGGAGAAAGGGGGPVGGFLTGGLFNTPFSFAGGGYTGDGARSGGVDGMGGFPAILHPQETVVDHTAPAAPLRPAGEYGLGEAQPPEITYSGAVLNFNGNEYVSKADVPKIIAASTAATGAKMRNSVSYRKRAGI